MDAAPRAAPVTMDAGPEKPKVEIVVFRFKTKPSKATIWWGDTLICEPTPCDSKFPKDNKIYELTAEAKGLIGTIKLNPVSSKQELFTRLRKPAKGAVIRKRLKRPPTDDGKKSGNGAENTKTKSTSDDTAGGDLTGRPDFGSSKKKQ